MNAISDAMNVASGQAEIPATNSQIDHPIDSKSNARTIHALTDHSDELSSLASQADDAVAFLRQAMRRIAQWHETIGFGMKGRIGADTFTDFSRTRQLSDDEASELRRLATQDVLACCGESGSFLSGPHCIGRFEVNLLTIAVNYQATGDTIAAVCLATRKDIHPDQDFFSVEVKSSVLQAVSLACQLGSGVGERETPPALDRAMRASRYATTEQLAFVLVGSLAERYRCRYVALGLRTTTGIRVEAVSSTDLVKQNAPGVVEIQQAMEEALDATAPIAYPCPASTDDVKVLPIHRQWGESSRSTVFSVPLIAENACLGVISFQRDCADSFTSEELISMQKTVESFTPGIDLSVRGHRSLKQHFWDDAGKHWNSLQNPTSRIAACVRNTIVVGILILIFGWWPYRPVVSSNIVASNSVQTLAPFDARLAESFVRSGDRVSEGQVLATLETKELQLERNVLRSHREQAEIDVRTALVKGDVAAAALAKSKVDLFENQLAVVQRKLSLCTIKAPADGMIVDANLGLRVGQIFPQGEPLLSFAPMDSFELEMQVPEHQVRFLAENQSGRFVPVADPNRPVSYTVESIAGSAQVLDGQNVFVVRAKLHDNTMPFRQGMEGFAKTDTGWRPIPWILFHRIIETIRGGIWL